MKEVKLREICRIEKGKQIDTSQLRTDSPYKYINGGIKESGYYHEYNTDSEAVLVSEGGASCGYVNYVNEKFWCGCHCYKLTESKTLAKYLYYALKGNQDKIMELRSGAAMPNIKKEVFKNMSLLVDFDKNNQQAIVETLDCIQKAINNKTDELSSLDELVKSRFIEMFIGKGFEQCKIKYLVYRKITTSKKGHLPTDLIKYIDISSIDNQKNEVVSYTEYKLLDAPSRAQQCLIENDILVSTVRPNLKNIAINRYNDSNVVGSSGFCVLRSTLCNPLYLLHCILTDDFTTQMTALTSGASYPAIRDNDVIDYEVINPPIELQNQFAEFVKLIDKSKFVCHSKNFLCDIFTFSSSTIAYPSVVSIFVCPKRC